MIKNNRITESISYYTRACVCVCVRVWIKRSKFGPYLKKNYSTIERKQSRNNLDGEVKKVLS